MYSDTEIQRRRPWTKIVTKAAPTSTRDVELFRHPKQSLRRLWVTKKFDISCWRRRCCYSRELSHVYIICIYHVYIYHQQYIKRQIVYIYIYIYTYIHPRCIIHPTCITYIYIYIWHIYHNIYIHIIYLSCWHHMIYIYIYNTIIRYIDMQYI